MSRIQVLPLPAEPDGRVPFLLIIDQCTDEDLDVLQETGELFARTGARGVLCFAGMELTVVVGVELDEDTRAALARVAVA